MSERVQVVVVDDQYLARGFFEGLVRMSERYELAASLSSAEQAVSWCLDHPADLVIMTNDGTRGDRVLDRVGNTSRRVFWRNGVDLPDPEEIDAPGRLSLDPGDRLLVTLSRLNHWKHVERAVQAMPAVLKVHPEARLLVMGYGPEQESLEALARELGVAERVSFTGQIPHSTTCAYLRQAEIFLSFYDPSNLGTNEPFAYV